MNDIHWFPVALGGFASYPVIVWIGGAICDKICVDFEIVTRPEDDDNEK